MAHQDTSNPFMSLPNTQIPDPNFDTPQFSTQVETSKPKNKNKAKKKPQPNDDCDIIKNPTTWQKRENTRLCEAYKQISDAPKVGGGGFWKRVYDLYHTGLPLDFPSHRNEQNFRQHFRPLSAKCVKYHSKLQACMRRHESGTVEADKVKEALSLYYAEEKHEFYHQEAYGVLKMCQKWLVDEVDSKQNKGSGKTTKKIRTEVGSSPSSFETQSPNPNPDDVEEGVVAPTHGPSPIERNVAKANQSPDDVEEGVVAPTHGPSPIERNAAKANQSGGSSNQSSLALEVAKTQMEMGLELKDVLVEAEKRKQEAEKRKREKQDLAILAMNPNEPGKTSGYAKLVTKLQREVFARHGVAMDEDEDY